MGKKKQVIKLNSGIASFKERPVWKEYLESVCINTNEENVEGISAIKKEIFTSIVSGSVIVDAGCREGSWIRSVNHEIQNPEEVFRIGIDPIHNGYAQPQFHIYINCALGKEDIECVDFNTYNEPGCNSLFEASTSLLECDDTNRAFVEKVQVPQLTLSNILKTFGIGEIFYLKTDCQGSDLNIIKGLGEYIDKVTYVEMECSLDLEHPFYVGANTVEEAIEYMYSKGFHLIEFTWFPGSPLAEGEIVFASNKINDTNLEKV